MQEKTTFTFGSKEGIHHFKINPHLAGSWVGNGNSHLDKAAWVTEEVLVAQLGCLVWDKWFQSGKFAGHPGKPKMCQGEVLGYFRALLNRSSALEELSIGGHRVGSVRKWLQCLW